MRKTYYDSTMMSSRSLTWIKTASIIIVAVLCCAANELALEVRAEEKSIFETTAAHADSDKPESDGDGPAAVVESETSLQKDKKSEPVKREKRNKANANSLPGGDPRGDTDIVICSQNLKLFGTYETMSRSNPNFTRQKYEQKIDDLVTRFVNAKCDVVAVQEVIGKNLLEGELALNQLAVRWKGRTNRVFKAMSAPPSEGSMTNGFIVALDRATVLQSMPYGRIELPKIWSRQKPRLFSRPPFELQLSVKSRDSDVVKTISIVNFHFKSKRGGQDDPTGLEWETYRMEMGEGLRRVLEMRHKDAFASGESILVALGDRNSNFDVASARILEGSLSLSSFGEKGPCRLSKRGVPMCVVDSATPRKLFSVLTSNSAVASYPGTFSYKGEYSWIDEIALPSESLRYAWQSAFSEGEYASGVVYEPQGASDHALVYVKLNW
jgi:hypothetical protein